MRGLKGDFATPAILAMVSGLQALAASFAAPAMQRVVTER